MIEFNIEEMKFNVNIMNLNDEDHVINISICIDEIYNLIVCKDCGIGVPFERISSHLSENHEIKVI